jgi:hypothetical protein
MSNIITPFGSGLHRQLARFEESTFNKKMWANHLIDNQEGIVVNNTSGTLHYDDHKKMLDDVVMARKFIPTGYRALSAIPGVAVNCSLYDTLVGYQDMNEFAAGTSMNGSNRQSNQSDYKYNWVPQPIYHCDFHIPWRQSGFSYKQSDGAQEASMQIELERDKTLFLGNDNIVVNVNGVDAQLYGLTNAPGVLSLAGSISDWADYNNADVIAKELISNIISPLYSQKKAAQVPNSLMVFVANDVWTNLENDYSSQKGDRTVLERMKAISTVRDVMPSQWLPDGACLVVEALPTTLRIPQAVDTTVAAWQQRDPMEDLRFTVWAASTLQVRQDRNGATGIAYATKA